MNAYALMLVKNQHAESLLAEASRRRAYTVAGPSLRDRIASVTNGLRRSLRSASSDSFLPTLQNYPYRG